MEGRHGSPVPLSVADTVCQANAQGAIESKERVCRTALISTPLVYCSYSFARVNNVSSHRWAVTVVDHSDEEKTNDSDREGKINLFAVN